MKKKKKKYANLIMLLLILLVLFFIVLQNKTINITVEELVFKYASNVSEADKIFLNKEIDISGKVNKLFSLEGKKSILELHSMNEGLKVYCILMKRETETKAESLTNGTSITIKGKCVGLKPEFLDNSSNVIYIETESIR